MTTSTPMVQSPSFIEQSVSATIQSNFPHIVPAETIRKLPVEDGQDYIVKDLIKPGVTILAGAPKRGKSMLALNISTDVATGEKIGGMIPVRRHDVLYISLEESMSQLSPKLDKLGGEKRLDGVRIATEWKKASRGGIIELEMYLVQNPTIRFVVIDIWSQFRGTPKKGAGSYNNEYKELEPLRNLAIKQDIAILLLHHQNKSSGKDWMKNLYGSNAMTGAVDSVMLLERETPTSPDAVLHVVGRDIPAQDWNMEFDPTTFRWKLAPKPLAKTPEQQTILDYLSGCNGPQRLKSIHDNVGKGTSQNTHKLLSRLNADGLVVKVSTGLYELSDTAIHYYSSRKAVDAVDSVENVSEDTCGGQN